MQRPMLKDAKDQIKAMPAAVQIWMRWLNISFLIGLVFLKEHDGARWALIAYAASFPAAFLIFYLTRRIHLTGLPHLVFWSPLLVYLPISVSAGPGVDLISAYHLWLVLLWLTIAICVILDLRALFAPPDRPRKH
ncbi:MAG: hypothetical protein ACON4C_00700 [Henriciella sp.]